MCKICFERSRCTKHVILAEERQSREALDLRRLRDGLSIGLIASTGALGTPRSSATGSDGAGAGAAPKLESTSDAAGARGADSSGSCKAMEPSCEPSIVGVQRRTLCVDSGSNPASLTAWTQVCCESDQISAPAVSIAGFSVRLKQGLDLLGLPRATHDEHTKSKL